MKKNNQNAYTLLYAAKKGFSGCMKIGLAFAGIALATSAFIDIKEKQQNKINNK
jgi:hypothetical protein